MSVLSHNLDLYIMILLYPEKRVTDHLYVCDVHISSLCIHFSKFGEKFNKYKETKVLTLLRFIVR